jgi:hypothetical protein
VGLARTEVVFKSQPWVENPTATIVPSLRDEAFPVAATKRAVNMDKQDGQDGEKGIVRRLQTG